ncbi:MAG: aminotransferase class III-fold pyridoxal phosphate-dependent enzyme [Anaerolineae bacterium]|nr:aminotransferase class III-fold pyridoxal phosphate-dependent enzyme [Anaerolineae bacterium]
MKTELLAPVWTHLTDMHPVRGEGIYLYDGEGKRYMDFTSGIGVVNTGHCHPRVVAAIQEQANHLIFGQMNIVIAPQAVALAEKLNEITPAGIDRFFFSNSGAEAVEASIKLARAAAERRNIIVMQGSFHGRTHQTMAMTTSKYVYRHNYQPLPSGVFVAPFPYSYYYGWDEEETIEFCLKQLDLLLHSQSAPDETAAIVIEPVLGEGGYVPAPSGYLQELRRICDKHEILLIVDEIQTGFGRTGKMFAFEHAEIVPDVIVMAKGLGSGLPISGIAASAKLMERWIPGTHGGTYGGGSAIAMAGASATLDVLMEEGLADNAAELGEYLLTQLEALKKKHAVIGDVRGRGLMIGVEFTDAQGKPDSEAASAVLEGCLERNMLILNCGSYKNVIRWIPPLVVTKEQIDEALAIFGEALAGIS